MTEGQRITVRIHFGDCEKDIALSRRIERWDMDAMLPIDEPSHDSPAFARYCCTPEGEARQAKERRAKIALLIADQLAAAIVEAMSKNDTINGYPRSEHEHRDLEG